MASHLRKLVYEEPGIPPSCTPFCLPMNTDGKCPSVCMLPCPFFCKTRTDNSPLPPSTTTPHSDYTTNHPSDHYDTSLATTVSVVFVVVSILIFLFIKLYALCRKNQSYELDPVACLDAFVDEDRGPNQGPAVEHHVWHIRTAVISEITLVKYKKGDGLVEGTDCSICLNGFEEDETLRLLLECRHAFHVTCIDTWLRSQTNCPLCRAGIVNIAFSVPSHEVIVQDAGPVEENLAEIRRSRSEGAGEGIEDGANSRNRIRTVGRSVSINVLSGSTVNAALANDSKRNSDDQQLVEVKELDNGIVGKRDGGINQLLRIVGSHSIERPACIKTSPSCSANI